MSVFKEFRHQNKERTYIITRKIVKSCFLVLRCRFFLYSTVSCCLTSCCYCYCCCCCCCCYEGCLLSLSQSTTSLPVALAWTAPVHLVPLGMASTAAEMLLDRFVMIFIISFSICLYACHPIYLAANHSFLDLVACYLQLFSCCYYFL